MMLLTSNVALVTDSFPNPDKQILVHLLNCSFKTNRPLSQTPQGHLPYRGGKKLKEAFIFLKRTDSNGNQIAGRTACLKRVVRKEISQLVNVKKSLKTNF